MMDQCSIVLYLHKKGLSPKEIHEDLVARLGPDAITYRTVARYVHDAKCTLPKVTSPHLPIGFRINPTNRITPFCLPLKNSRFRRFDSFYVPLIYHG
jgi:hypothetical protein